MVPDSTCNSGSGWCPTDLTASPADPPTPLLSLPGTALKLYLSLLCLRDTTDACPSSCRALSRHSGLARQTVARALAQLRGAGLVQLLGRGYRVETGPLTELLAQSARTPATEDASAGRGMSHPATADGPRVDHADDVTGTEGRQPAHHAHREVSQSADPAGKQVGHHASSTGREVDHPNHPSGEEVGRPGKELDHPGSAGGKELCHLEPTPGKQVGHPGKELDHPDSAGGKEVSHSPAPLTRARTSWPSSSEEGSVCTTPPPQERVSEAGTGEQDRGTTGTTMARPSGTARPSTASQSRPKAQDPSSSWIASMTAVWNRIAPGNHDDPDPWFRRMWQQHGQDIPLAALTQFAESGRRVADLDHPGRYPAYFRACCDRLAREGASDSLSPSRPGNRDSRSRTTAPAPGARGTAHNDDYRQDLRALYLADRQPASARTNLSATAHHRPAPPPGSVRGRPHTDAPRSREPPALALEHPRAGRPTRRAIPA